MRLVIELAQDYLVVGLELERNADNMHNLGCRIPKDDFSSRRVHVARSGLERVVEARSGLL